MISSYISEEFHFHEKKYYWEQCDESNTFCRIAVVIHRKHGDEMISERFSEPYFGKHAEIVALEYIVKDLESQKWMIEDNSAVVDVIIRINNSPCSDCQEELPDLLMRIRSIAPYSHFRLILFFSNLYDKTEEGIKEFSGWMRKLVKNHGVVVIVCPLFVTKMVPMPFKIKTADKDERSARDQDCILSFRKLLAEVKKHEHEGYFSTWQSHDLFQKDYEVFEWLFGWENPHFISVFPQLVNKRLKKLFIDPQFF